MFSGSVRLYRLVARPPHPRKNPGAAAVFLPATSSAFSGKPDGAILLVPGALAIVLVGYAEALGGAKAAAMQGGGDIDPNQELIAHGPANIPQSTRIVQRKRRPTSNVDSMMVLRARRGAIGSKYMTFRVGLPRAIPYPPRWVGR